MVELGADVRALLAQAQRAAQKRGQATTTAHILLALLEGQSDLGRLLAAHGARVTSCHEALRESSREANNAMALVLERARRIAQQSGARQTHPMHLLLASLQTARSEAARCLGSMGVTSDAIERVLEDSLGTPRRSSRAIAERAGHVRAEALRPLPRTLIDWEAQKRGVTATHPTARTGLRGLASASSLKRERAREMPVEQVQVPDTSAPKASPRKDVDAFVLDAQQFPLLSALGRNLSREAAEGRLDPVVGRDAEIERVLDVLARRRTNNPILVGPPGVGKTAIVEGVALSLLDENPQEDRRRVLIEFSAGALVSGTGVRGALAEKLARLRAEVQASEGRVLLFIDEIHALISSGDGPDELANELKAALARGEFPCIGATTDAEYRKVFERDQALSRRFSRIDVGEPSRDEALTILRGVSLHYERYHGVAYEEEALAAAVDLSMRYLPELHLPDKAIGVLDLAAARTRRRGSDVVDRAAVAAVVSAQAGVPIERLLMRDREQLLTLEDRLAQRVVGQDAAIARIASAVRRSAVGLRGKRPLGVFLLLGPTGVGKTELAKALCDELFTASGMTRLDMSEYSEPHAVARLFGAPPGYIGHEDGGQLTEAVRKRPYQLVLLDEVEKAHPDVLLTMLPLFDEGRLTDGRGRTIDFTNTVVVMTSNLGAHEKRRASSIGFAREQEASDEGDAVLQAARAALAPELWNRIDEVVCFPSLDLRTVGRIARRMLEGVARLLRSEQGLSLEVEESVIGALIAAGGFEPALGARPMRRTIAREVETPLSAALLSGRLGPGDTVRLFGEGAHVRVERVGGENGPSAQTL
jgi:ATP-dependent Clp protease ATP-binding subunit ClpC